MVAGNKVRRLTFSCFITLDECDGQNNGQNRRTYRRR